VGMRKPLETVGLRCDWGAARDPSGRCRSEGHSNRRPRSKLPPALENYVAS